MKSKKKITAILLVAGNSTRYNRGKNKNFECINGKPVMYYSLNAFDRNSNIDDIIVAVKEDEVPKVQEILEKEKFRKKIDIVIGGNTRKESVFHCINHTDSDIVVIHDGARPAMRDDYINKCVESMGEFKGATIAVKSKDTIKITDDNNIVVSTTNRNNTWLIQTPQCFDRRLLLDMHNKYNNSEVTDDCMLLEKDGYKVKVIEGDYTNIKITTFDDIIIVKEFMDDLIL